MDVRSKNPTSNAQLSTPKAFASSQPNAQPSVELHIEELVLDGFALGERYAIGEAVERELRQLLGERGIPSSLQSENATDELRGQTFNAAHNAKPPMVGRQIANAVYQAFGQ